MLDQPSGPGYPPTIEDGAGNGFLVVLRSFAMIDELVSLRISWYTEPLLSKDYTFLWDNTLDIGWYRSSNIFVEDTLPQTEHYLSSSMTYKKMFMSVASAVAKTGFVCQ